MATSLEVGTINTGSMFYIGGLNVETGRAVGVAHYLLGGIVTTWSFFLSRLQLV